MRFLEHTQTIEQLMTLSGDFPLPEGPVEQLEDGFSFATDTLTIRAKVETHPAGVWTRQDSIQNISDRAVTIRTALSRFQLTSWEVEVYTQFSQNCDEYQGRWQPLVTEISAHNYELRQSFGNSPFAAVYDLQTHRGGAFHVADSCLWRINVRRDFTQAFKRRYTAVELGPDPRNFACVLQPGETLTLPAIVYYEFRSKTDMDAWKLHRWCKATYMPEKFPVVYNSWMSKFDLISHELLSQQLEIAKELGMEYFVIDAGWFGEPYNWFPSAGDWKESEAFGMKGRMKEFADDVRAAGLKFGLWFEIERAGLLSQAYQEHPQFYLVEEKKAFVNFADPAACDYIFGVLAENVRKYGIEYIKFDFNAAVTFDPDRRAFLKYFEGYGAFIRRIRETFPGIYLEGCASGGMRIAISSLKYFDSFWLTDNQNQKDQLRIFKDAVVRMPARALENWVTISSLVNQTPGLKGGEPELTLSGNSSWNYVESMTESFLFASMWGGPMSVSCDLTRLSPAMRKKLAERAALMKTQRDYWLTAETRILTDTPAITALQYSDEAMTDIRVYVFNNVPQQNFYTVYPVCDPDAVYADAEGVEYTGRQLDETGIEVKTVAYRSAVEVLLKKVN